MPASGLNSTRDLLLCKTFCPGDMRGYDLVTAGYIVLIFNRFSMYYSMIKTITYECMAISIKYIISVVFKLFIPVKLLFQTLHGTQCL